MALDYKYLSQDHCDDSIIAEIMQREKEHYNYELNRINYLHMIDELKSSGIPDEWPSRLLRYKALTGELLAAAISGDDYTLVTKLQFRDRLLLLLATTEVEQKKVEFIYKALVKQSPEGHRLNAAMARIKK